MPLDTVLLLDTSGSMAGRGMRELKIAANKFVEGVEQTAKESGLKENISVVEFGKNKHVVQSLTTDYPKVHRAINGLEAGGRTPMVEGMLSALQEIMKNGGVVTVAGTKISPRIIMFTDGVPTDEKDGETVEVKFKVLATAAIFGQSSDDVKLPYAVPVACVGCGDCDPDLLEGIAKVSRGMFKVVGDIEELSGFFKKQVLLIRFIAQTGGDLAQLRDALVLRRFLEAMGEAVAEAELDGLLQFLLTLIGLEALAGGSSTPSVELSNLPPLGSRVRRGKDWKWGDQDKGGPGTIIEHRPGGIVRVEWDCGFKDVYRHGAENAHDLQVINEPRIIEPGQPIKVGARVKRGPDWKWGTQDGGGAGTVFEVQADKWVKVRWSNGVKANYRYGNDGKFDLEVINSGSPSGPGAAGTKVEVDESGVEVITAMSTDGIGARGGGSGGSDQMACWQFLDDKQTWNFMTGNVAQFFEKKYQGNKNGSFQCEFNRFKYTVDLARMVQINAKTKKERKIKRTMMSKTDFDLGRAAEKSLTMKGK